MSESIKKSESKRSRRVRGLLLDLGDLSIWPPARFFDRFRGLTEGNHRVDRNGLEDRPMGRRGGWEEGNGS